MGDLMASLLNSASALSVYEQALTVTENNVVNANTPGYAKQSATFEAEPFDLTVGLAGGVLAGPVQSSRDAFAEQAVRSQQTSVNFYQQKIADLTPVENYFPTSSTSGIPPDMTQFFNDFSALSVNPNDTVARQTVLNDASTVAQDFNFAANGVLNQSASMEQQTSSTITSINQLAGTIASLNTDDRVDPSGAVNAGVDAQLNSTLEQLSQLVNFTALQQPDGTVSIYAGGQTPLVVGDQTYDIQSNSSNSQTSILSSTGSDITDQITGGQLGALIDDHNNTLPSYLSSLNTLAQSFADQVNTALDNGIDQNGAAPSTDLYTYNASQGAALTLATNPLTPDQIAAALPGAPGGNGNALIVANLANAQTVNGYTFAQFYGTIGGQVGNDVSSATNSQATQESLLNQAQSQRQQISGVNLDEEAENLLEYQRSYEAISKMITTINSITDTLMNAVGVVTT
jgi:flagellar hook-associated protein 1 FlgK